MKKLVTSLFAVLLLVGVGNAKQATTQYERALINAAKEGNASQVRGLLEAGTDPNVTDEHENTPLIYGAKESAAIVDMLLYAGADVNARGENGITPLINSFAVVGPEANTIRTRLLKAKPDVNAVMNLPRCNSADRIWGTYLWGEDQFWRDSLKCGPNPTTALSLAAASNDITAVQTLLKNGADVNIGFPIDTAIHSSKPNSTKIVEILLKAGADPWRTYMEGIHGNGITDKENKKALIDKAKNTPDKAQQKLNDKLCTAAGKGNVKKVKKLLEQGADPNGYCAPLYAAVFDPPLKDKNTNVEVVKVLLEAGANPNVHFGTHYDTPLMEALCTDYVGLDVVKALIAAGADVNARNASYSTALYHACNAKEDEEKVKLLLQAGADVNVRNMYGRTPLFGAEEKHAELYINAGADVNARDYEGLSALFHVSINPRLAPCAELLQMHGAKLTPYEKRLLPIMQQRWQLNRERNAAEVAQYEAEEKKNSFGGILTQGLLNAANDTANFAIQNAGKF